MSANSQLAAVLREIENGHGLPSGALTAQGGKSLANDRGTIYNNLEDSENSAMLEDWYEGNVPAGALRRAGLPEISQAIRIADGATPLESPEIASAALPVINWIVKQILKKATRKAITYDLPDALAPGPDDDFTGPVRPAPTPMPSPGDDDFIGPVRPSPAPKPKRKPSPLWPPDAAPEPQPGPPR